MSSWRAFGETSCATSSTHLHLPHTIINAVSYFSDAEAEKRGYTPASCRLIVCRMPYSSTLPSHGC